MSLYDNGGVVWGVWVRREQNPGLKQTELMKIIAALWHESDEKKVADAHRAEQETLRADAETKQKEDGDLTTAWWVVVPIGHVAVEVVHDQAVVGEVVDEVSVRPFWGL